MINHTFSFESVLSCVVVRDHEKRRVAYDEAVKRIRETEDKGSLIAPILDKFVKIVFDDGLDLAKGLLLEIGEPVLDFAERYIDGTRARLFGLNKMDGDVIYVLLRTLGESDLDRERVMRLCKICYDHGTPDKRDAALWALGDTGTPEALELVRTRGLKDCSAMVRETAALVLKEHENV
jgi:hypothetical protein